MTIEKQIYFIQMLENSTEKMAVLESLKVYKRRYAPGSKTVVVEMSGREFKRFEEYKEMEEYLKTKNKK